MSHAEPHIIGLCPSTSYLLQMYIKRRTNKRPEKKTTVFTKKICKFKTSYYLCNTKFQRWIHLRVRIRASHARHRGSNPLSTTKSDCNSRFFYYWLSGVTGQGEENPIRTNGAARPGRTPFEPPSRDVWRQAKRNQFPIHYRKQL